MTETQSEAEYQASLVRSLREAGWTVIKMDPGTGTIPKGWPDLLCLDGRGQVFFVECKVLDGELTDMQRRTLRLLTLSGYKACVVDGSLGYCWPFAMTLEEIETYGRP